MCVHEVGVSVCCPIVAIFAMLAVCCSRYGRVCNLVAANYQKDGFVYGIYVQGNVFDFCVAAVGFDFWRVDFVD